jgi:hypothetical protein
MCLRKHARYVYAYFNTQGVKERYSDYLSAYYRTLSLPLFSNNGLTLTRNRNNEHIILLMFLAILLRVLRLEASVCIS